MAFRRRRYVYMIAEVNKSIPADLLVPYLIYEYVIDESPSTGSYDDRKVWQKVGFLAQSLGLPLNEYQFNWYKAGPYSPSYTSVLYSIDQNMDQFKNDMQNYELKDSAKNKLRPLRNLVQNKPKGITLPSWLELLSSILYIREESGYDKKDCLKKLVRLKPFFDQSDINSLAWDLLYEENML